MSLTRALVVEEIGGANASPGIRALITLQVVLPNGVTASCRIYLGLLKTSMILRYPGRPLSLHGACGLRRTPQVLCKFDFDQITKKGRRTLKGKARGCSSSGPSPCRSYDKPMESPLRYNVGSEVFFFWTFLSQPLWG